jgi:hypothetical protein
MRPAWLNSISLFKGVFPMQYKTNTLIRHDGVDRQPGEIVDLSEVDAAALLELGAVIPVDQPFSAILNELGNQ